MCLLTGENFACGSRECFCCFKNAPSSNVGQMFSLKLPQNQMVQLQREILWYEQHFHGKVPQLTWMSVEVSYSLAVVWVGESIPKLMFFSLIPFAKLVKLWFIKPRSHLIQTTLNCWWAECRDFLLLTNPTESHFRGKLLFPSFDAFKIEIFRFKFFNVHSFKEVGLTNAKPHCWEAMTYLLA